MDVDGVTVTAVAAAVAAVVAAVVAGSVAGSVAAAVAAAAEARAEVAVSAAAEAVPIAVPVRDSAPVLRRAAPAARDSVVRTDRANRPKNARVRALARPMQSMSASLSTIN